MLIDQLTDEQIHSGNQRPDERRLTLAGLEVVEQFEVEDAEGVADAVDDEVREEGCGADRPAPATVRRYRQVVDAAFLSDDLDVLHAGDRLLSFRHGASSVAVGKVTEGETLAE